MQLLPPCVEVIYDGSYTVVAAYGTSEKVKDGFIHLPTYTRYVNLGFNKGTQLHDPRGLLEGTGRLIRHIRISESAQLDDPAIVALIDEAVRLSGAATMNLIARTEINVFDGPKKRPNMPKL